MLASVQINPLYIDKDSVSPSVVLTATLLILLQVLDALLTHHGLSLYGSVHGEGNILLRYIMAEVGVIPTLVIAKSIAILFIIGLCMLSQKVIWVELALKVLAALYITCAIIPWFSILIEGLF